MPKDKSMSLEEHIALADDLAIAAHHLTKVFFKCQEHYPKSHRLMKLLDKFLPSAPNSIFSELKSALDSEYHQVATDEQFQDYGHVYYNLEARYERIAK